MASTAIVPFRDLFLLVFPVTITLKPFLAKKGHSAEEVEKLYAAWLECSNRAGQSLAVTGTHG